MRADDHKSAGRALPVGRPKKVELTVNLKEAPAMGLKIPMDVLTAATKVIK